MHCLDRSGAAFPDFLLWFVGRSRGVEDASINLYSAYTVYTMVGRRLVRYSNLVYTFEYTLYLCAAKCYLIISIVVVCGL
jgi:hypothetical protein